jgi:hypothetical protein
MSQTTIKVDTAVRDRLSALARKREVTLGELVNELVERAEHEQYWAEIYAGYERLRANPEEWADYMAELHSWTDARDPDSIWSDNQAAREEWPEYNS